MFASFAPNSRAQAPQPAPSISVLLVRVPGDSPTVIRLRAELGGYHVRVVELNDRPQRRDRALSELAEQFGTDAAMRATPEAKAVELWVSSQDSAELVSAGPAGDPEVLAMRVTEALRARGLSLAALPAQRAQTDTGAEEPSEPSEPSTGAGAASAASAIGKATGTITASPAGSTPSAATDGAQSAAGSDSTAAPPASGAETTGATAPPSAAPDAEEIDTPLQAATPAQPADSQAEAGTTPAPAKTPERRSDTIATRAVPAVPFTAPVSEAEAEAGTPRRDGQDGQEEQDEPEPTESAAAAAPSRPAAPPRDALVYLEAGPAGVWSPGTQHVGPSLDALLGLRFRPYPTSSLSLVGLIPLLTTNVSDTTGANVEVQTFGIGGFGDLHMPFDQLELSAGLGGLALLSAVRVVDAADYVQQDVSTQRLAALLGRLGVGWSATPDLRLSASVMGGLVVNALEIQFNDLTVAEWGRPLLIGTLSMELALPWER